MVLKDQANPSIAPSAYQKPLKSVRPPLIPTEDETERQEEGFFGSLGKLFVYAGACFAEIFGGIIPGLKKKPQSYQYPIQQNYQQPQKHSNAWPLQESYVIPDEDEPPSIDTRTPTPRKTYPFMSKDAEKMHQIRQSRAFVNGWDADLQQQQKQHHHRHYSSIPHTYYEQSCEKTNEIVFGAVQEQEVRREPVVIKPVNYGDPIYDHHNIRNRAHSKGYTQGY